MRCHTSRRWSIGICTESMPNSATPRRMNGKTVDSSAMPPVLPDAATAPPYFSVRRMYGSVGRADAVDRASPALAFERLAGAGRLGPAEHLGGTEALEEPLSVGLAGGRRHLVAAVGEDADRHRANAAGGTGDEHRALARAETVRLERVNGQRGSETGSSDRHSLRRRQRVRQRDDPFRR